MVGVLGSWMMLDLRGMWGIMQGLRGGAWMPPSATELVLAGLVALLWPTQSVSWRAVSCIFRHRTSLDALLHSMVALAVAPMAAVKLGTFGVMAVYVLAACAAHVLKRMVLTVGAPPSGAYAGLLAVVVAAGMRRQTTVPGLWWWHRLASVVGLVDERVMLRGLFGYDWSVGGLVGLVMVLEVCSELVAGLGEGYVEPRRVGGALVIGAGISCLVKIFDTLFLLHS